MPADCLLLKVVQSVDVKYPSLPLPAVVIEILGVDVPFATLIGPLPETLVTVPLPPGDVHERLPAPFEVKTWPFVP